MQQDEIFHLLEKYLKGTATTAEQNKLLTWYREEGQKTVEWISVSPDEEIIVKDRVLAQLKAKIHAEQPNVSRSFWYRVAAAATIIMAFSLWLYFDNGSTEKYPESIVNNEHFKNDIPYGGNIATLTLADGSEIFLDNQENGIISQQRGVVINKFNDAQIVYRSKDQIVKSSQINKISTPKGGQYQVVLSDGTKVWLNSESSLTFPTAFSGNKREVIVAGEVYFEVAKDKDKPFRVKANNVSVNVLGTHFNIMAYLDEGKTTTTLLEGSVQIENTLESIILKPGEQANVYDGSSKIKVHDADIEGTIAWKDGYFMFNNEGIQSVMRKISRWYDVEVSYEGNVSNKLLWGTMSRFQNISEVLNMLELTGLVHFKIEGRRITVMP